MDTLQSDGAYPRRERRGIAPVPRINAAVVATRQFVRDYEVNRGA